MENSPTIWMIILDVKFPEILSKVPLKRIITETIAPIINEIMIFIYDLHPQDDFIIYNIP